MTLTRSDARHGAGGGSGRRGAGGRRGRWAAGRERAGRGRGAARAAALAERSAAGVVGRAASPAATGRGGTDGTCRPTGAENCFNNYDDDCDGNIDCADSDCTAIAQCAPLDPAWRARRDGVRGSRAARPATRICTRSYPGPNAGGCTGCSCRPPAVTCSATVYSFGTATACASATTPGVAELTFSSTQPCTVPSWIGSTQGTIYGVQASTFMVSLAGGCVPSGTPTPSPLTWANTSRFCAASMVGGGCGGGQVCAPPVAASRCAMFDGAHAVPAQHDRLILVHGRQRRADVQLVQRATRRTAPAVRA